MTEPTTPQAPAEAPQEADPPGTLRLVEFNVPIGPGRLAVVALPTGVTAGEMLRLIAALPGIGAEASRMGGPAAPPSVLSRLVGLDGNRLG